MWVGFKFFTQIPALLAPTSSSYPPSNQSLFSFTVKFKVSLYLIVNLHRSLLHSKPYLIATDKCRYHPFQTSFSLQQWRSTQNITTGYNTASYQWIMLSQLRKSKFTTIFILCFSHFSERVVRYICQIISHGMFYHTYSIICASWTEVANNILYSRISLWLSPDFIAIGFQQSAFSVHLDIFF